MIIELAFLGLIAAAPEGVVSSSTVTASSTVTVPLVATASAAEVVREDLAVDVVDRRLPHTFDPHARLALSGRRIAELGITNLAEALEHIPAAFVRTAGRGGFQVDVRGARKGALLVLIDGMPISDPFFGNFDVASIPATDIAEIRVSNAPASPIDGPGGNGGVVEVITRSAAGRARAFVRASAGTAPGGRAAVSAKGELGEGFAVRVSGTGSVDARDFTIRPTGLPESTVDQSGRSAHGAVLVERVGEGTRVGLDVAAGRQSYLVPPSEDDGADLTLIDGETTLRASLLGEVSGETVRTSVRAFAHTLERSSLRYRDGNLAGVGARADVEASRYGAFARSDWQAFDALLLTGSASIINERGRESGDAGDGADGEVSVLQAGAAARWAAFEWWSIDAAAGAAVPLSGGGEAWPEARLSLELTSEAADLTLIAARKGRVPTLRERFQPNTGNAAIAPEHSSYAEAVLIVRPFDFAALTTSGWVRDIEGVIKIPLGGNQLDNVGDLLTGGLDVRLDLSFLESRLEVGGSYQLQAQDGESPFDFFPTHRGEVWLRGKVTRELGLWARGKYLGDRIDQGQSLGDLATLDLGGWVRIDTIRVVARVENLADASWLAHVGVPGYGRTVWLGLEAETP